ncbi:hypothetical protein [Billgrantia endophytica]|uniref:hypothetical protein n=1 Tax=Billgrantia endophytica TaxID=2033802 RepID=UPI001054E0E5|nr:hypothetical protein [Halomonas endophytica]
MNPRVMASGPRVAGGPAFEMGRSPFELHIACQMPAMSPKKPPVLVTARVAVANRSIIGTGIRHSLVEDLTFLYSNVDNETLLLEWEDVVEAVGLADSGAA